MVNLKHMDILLNAGVVMNIINKLLGIMGMIKYPLYVDHIICYNNYINSRKLSYSFDGDTGERNDPYMPNPILYNPFSHSSK